MQQEVLHQVRATSQIYRCLTRQVRLPTQASCPKVNTSRRLGCFMIVLCTHAHSALQEGEQAESQLSFSHANGNFTRSERGSLCMHYCFRVLNFISFCSSTANIVYFWLVARPENPSGMRDCKNGRKILCCVRQAVRS